MKLLMNTSHFYLSLINKKIAVKRLFKKYAEIGIRTPAPVTRPHSFQDCSLQPDLSTAAYWSVLLELNQSTQICSLLSNRLTQNAWCRVSESNGDRWIFSPLH